MKKENKAKHTNLRIEEEMFNKISQIQLKEIKRHDKVINLSDTIRKILELGINSYEKK